MRFLRSGFPVAVLLSLAPLASLGCSSAAESATSNGTGAAVTVDAPAAFTAASVVAGANSTCALSAAGDAKCWGDNTFGQAGAQNVFGGHGDRGPIPVAKFPGQMLQVAVGSASACGVVLGDPLLSATTLIEPDDGIVQSLNGPGTVDIYCWGLPNLPTLDSMVPGSGSPGGQPQLLAPFDGLQATENFTIVSKVTAIAMNGIEDMCLADLNGVDCFRGLTHYNVAGLAGKSISKIVMSTSHACALANDGIWCWGSNKYGQLGGGTASMTDDITTTAVQAILPDVASDVSVGTDNTCAVTTAGVFCVGLDGFGQLGDNSAAFSQPSWVAVQGLPAAVPSSIETNVAHSCAVVSGDVYCWGENSYSALGNGTQSVVQKSAVKLSGFTSQVTALTLGIYFGCATTADGVECWGQNDQGQLGGKDPDTEDQATPIAVLSAAPTSAN